MRTQLYFVACAIILLCIAPSVKGQGISNQTTEPSPLTLKKKALQTRTHQNVTAAAVQSELNQAIKEKTGEFDTLFSENFDQGTTCCLFQDLWSESFWHLSPTGAYSGNSYWCAVEEQGGYDDNWIQTLTSPPIDLLGTSAPLLTFIHQFNVELMQGTAEGFDAFDAITLRVSTDGESFYAIHPSEGIEYQAQNAFCYYFRFGSGIPGWTGESIDWIASSFDLTPYAGQTVWIQFLFGSDFGWSGESDPSLFGWRVDNVVVEDGSTVLFSDDGGDTGDALLVAGGPGGPNPWHLTTDAAASPPYSSQCCHVAMGSYLSSMKAGLSSPAIDLSILTPHTTALMANAHIKGKLDYSMDELGITDFFLIEARGFYSGKWSYWNWISETFALPDAFCEYNDICLFDMDLSYLLGADSVQLRLIVNSLPDGQVLEGSTVFIDNLTLTARTGYEGSQFGSFYDQIIETAGSERQAVADSFMATLATCPLVEENSITTFLYQGDVSSVSVPGDVNNWNVYAEPMTAIPETDLWFYQTRYEADARLEYKFFLNNMTWTADPLNPDQADYGTMNSQISMPEYIPPAEIELNPDIPHGTVFDTTITSAILNNTRSIKIYTPPGYESFPDKNYPVIFFHDGPTFYNIGKLNNIFDNLLAEYRIRQVIAVFVPPVDRDNEYAFDKTNLFEAFCVEELLPFIETNYRVIQAPESRAMIGFSFGGLITTQICYNNPEVFGLCAPMSPAYWPKNFEILHSVINGSSVPVKFYVDWGKYEFSIMQYATILKDHLEASEYELIWNQWNEAHNFGNWRGHVDNVLEYFFPAVTDIADLKEYAPFLLAVAPNPINENTIISFHLPADAELIISVFDLSGKTIGSEVLKKLPAGDHQLRLITDIMKETIPENGVYFIQLSTGILEETEKIIVLR